MPGDVDVLVVSAGIAGVATAWELRQAGIPSIVLEAQDRLGGRIWTSRTWKKLPVDVGGAHLTINPVVELAGKNKIALKPSSLRNLSITDA
jgi:monoamine oxidase